MRLNEPELRPKLRPTHDQRIVRRDNQRGAGTSVEPVMPCEFPRNGLSSAQRGLRCYPGNFGTDVQGSHRLPPPRISRFAAATA